MNIYVESNFVLELALEQAESSSCDGFSPQDAIVYASILAHIGRYNRRKSYFLCRDRHFFDQDVIDDIGSYGCELVPRFNQGYQSIIRDLGITQARR